MIRFIEAILHNARFVLAGLVVLLVFGILAFKLMPLEADPDIPLPFVYTQMSLPGISPEDAERLLARPMERKLQTIAGLDEIRSVSYLGGASVVLKFEAGFDSDKALNDVREKVDLAKADLPTEVEEPTIHETNVSLFPVLIVTLSGNLPEETLLRIARKLQDKIEGLSAVLEAKISGDREDVVVAEIDPLRLQSYGLNADAITQLVNRSNRLIPAGTLDNGKGRFALKVPGLFENINDILNMPLKANQGAVVRLKDVATIRPTFKDPVTIARIDGLPAIGIEITKRSGENIISTIEDVRRTVAEEQRDWPAQIKVVYSQDKSQQIKDMLSDLANNLISAVLLVMIVVIGSLGLRSGLIVGLSVPGSFLLGILVLYLTGLTINIVVLFSLIMATGMLVDGAIVLVEYADRRMLEGANKAKAYAEAAGRMAWPIFSSTATIIAAFLPLLFWPGLVGQFMRFLPITLLAVLGASLAMALIFIPCVGALLGKPGKGASHLLESERLPVEEQLRRAGGLEKYYLKGLRFCLKHPLLTVIAGLLVLFLVYAGHARFGAGVQFFPDIEPTNAVVKVHARGNIAMAERSRLLGEVENIALSLNRERQEMASVYAVATAGEAQQFGNDVAEDVIGTLYLEFGPWDQRRPAKQILKEIETKAQKLSGLYTETEIQRSGPDAGKPVQVRLASDDQSKLIAATQLVRAHMQTLPGLTALEDTLPVPGIEWQLNIDRAEAAKSGTDITTIGNVVELLTEGFKFGTYRPDTSEDEVDIVARYPLLYRKISEIDQLRVTTEGGTIPISNFVTRKAVPHVGLINRVEGKRIYVVKADVKPGILADTEIQAIQSWLANAGIDPAVTVSFEGQDKEQKKSQTFLIRAFIVALALIAAILLAHFNSFFHVFLIMTACIMSTIGVMAGLLITGQPFGIVMSGIGIISLAGIVVSNNIILIDTYVEHRKHSKNAKEALLLSGVQRFRPVFLTTVTTILGLVPLVFQVNLDFLSRHVSVGAPSTQWWTQLASAVVFGLLFAKALTLLFTPCSLLLADRLGMWLNSQQPVKTKIRMQFHRLLGFHKSS